MRRRLPLALVAIFLFAASCNQSVASPESEAWDTWRHIPLLHQGRIKPVDTFARQAVQIVTHCQWPPKLEIDGETRKFPQAELLFSWMVEPEAWEEREFLYAEHHELREKYLNLEAKGRYVSPAQIEDAPRFWEAMEDIQQKAREARRKGEEFRPNTLEERIQDLFKAYLTFRGLAIKYVDLDTHLGLRSKVGQMDQIWSQTKQVTQVFAAMEQGEKGLGFAKAQEDYDKLKQQIFSPWAGVREVDQALKAFDDSLRQTNRTLAEAVVGFQKNPPASLDKETVEQLRERFVFVIGRYQQLRQLAQSMRSSIYDNSEEFRVVPALNAEALEADRDPNETHQPWLDLQTVLLGDKAWLAEKGYPVEDFKVRNRFADLEAAFKARNWPQFADKMTEFSESLRYLADQIEPLRDELDIKKRDEDLIAAITYPGPTFTAREVRYNTFDPFFVACLISFLAMVCFAMAFGILRKPMLWTGLAIVALSLAVMTYGFYLRVMITGWAPVTNMYETVIFVAYFVSLMGAWFLLLPVTWSGLKLSWRMNAIPFFQNPAGPDAPSSVPFLWEARPLTANEQEVMSERTANLFGFLFLLPRVLLMAGIFYVLMMAPYAAGGRTILSMLPDLEALASAELAWSDKLYETFNKLLVWFVGWCCCIPTVWFLPRAILALVTSVVIVPVFRLVSSEQAMAKVYPRWAFGMASTGAAFLGAATASYSPVLDGNFQALQPILRDNFWLTIHVITIVSSYGAGALAWGLGMIGLCYYLFGRYRDPVEGLQTPEGHEPAADVQPPARLTKRPPEATAALASYTYKAIQVAVLLLAAGTILGGLWADVSWGRFWGWDPKEVWALISLLVYLAILHGRFAGWFGNFGLVAGSVMGFTAIIMSWYGVNFVLGAGLHSYGFGQGGQLEMGIIVALNWIFLWAAFVRYYIETKTPITPRSTPTKPGAGVAK